MHENEELVVEMIYSWVSLGQSNKIDDHLMYDHFCSVFDPLIHSDISSRYDMRDLINTVEEIRKADVAWEDDDGTYQDVNEYIYHKEILIGVVEDIMRKVSLL